MKQGDLAFKKNYRLRQSIFVVLGRIILLEVISILAGFVLYFIFNQIDTASIAFFMLEIINIIFLVAIFLTWYFRYYIISPDGISITSGVLFKDTQTCDIHSIRSVKIHQTILQRIFRYGDIELESPLLTKNIFIKKVQNPYNHGKRIDKQRLKHLEDKSISNITPVV